MGQKLLRLVILTLIALLNSCAQKDIPRPAPKAEFIWQNRGEGNVQFTDQSEEADTFEWTFGDNSAKSTEKNPVHIYPRNGQYIVGLTVKNSVGTDFLTQQINVSTFAAPLANFAVSLGLDGGLIFANTSINAQEYVWEFGDGSTSRQENPTHIYTENKKYTISLTAIGKGGSAKTTKEIEVVTARPVIDFSWTETNGLVTFTNKSRNADSYNWDFGNGKTSTETNPTYRFLKAGTYSVKLTAKNKAGELSKTAQVSINYVALTLADVVDDQSLMDFLPGVWGAYVDGQDMKYDNYVYKFSQSTNTMNYENRYNNYYTTIDPQTLKLDYKFSVADKVIYTEETGQKLKKYARFQVLSSDEIKWFRIIETSTSYTELLPFVLTRTSDVERQMGEVVRSNQLLSILRGVWEQGSYSIYTDVAFDFSAGKNYYQYNETFRDAKSIDKYEYKIDGNNIMSFRYWNSSFDPAWKKYKVEVVSTTQLRLYSINESGKVSPSPEYTLTKRN